MADFEVTFVDVGHGDETLIKIPGDRYVLVDIYRCPGEGIDLFKEIARPQASLISLDDQHALARENEERLLVLLGVIQARLSRLENDEVDPQLVDLDRAVAVLVLEAASGAP